MMRLLRRSFVPLLRVAALFAALTAIVTSVALYRARARYDELLLGLGAEMLRYEDPAYQDAPRRLVLNGQPLSLMSGTARETVEGVLDRYEARCRARSGTLAGAVAGIRGGAGGAAPQGREPAQLPVLRDEAGNVGFVACVDPGSTELRADGLFRRLQAFGRTQDLGELGGFRYVFARRMGETTHFLALWTDGSFSVARMFPERGDAPGRDVPGIARPAGARRVLSFWEESAPQSMTLYSGAEATPAALTRRYREELRAQGWRELSRAPASEAADGSATLVLERGELTVQLRIGGTPDGRSAVSVLTDGRTP